MRFYPTTRPVYKDGILDATLPAKSQSAIIAPSQTCSRLQQCVTSGKACRRRFFVRFEAIGRTKNSVLLLQQSRHISRKNQPSIPISVFPIDEYVLGSTIERMLSRAQYIDTLISACPLFNISMPMPKPFQLLLSVLATKHTHPVSTIQLPKSDSPFIFLSSPKQPKPPHHPNTSSPPPSPLLSKPSTLPSTPSP